MDIKYQRENKDDFFSTLSQRVNNYFKTNSISKNTNFFGVFKAIFFISLFLGAYALVIFANGNSAQLLVSFFIIGFVQICIVLNIGHEGVHSSFSKNKIVNHLASYTFDIIGSSGYLWKLRHVNSHHPFTMIPSHDVDIRQSEMLTFVPMEKPKPVYKYQHIYLPFLYLLYTLNAILKRDWEDLFSGKMGNIQSVKHPLSKYFWFVFFKLFYFSYALVLPLLFSGCSWPIVVLGFVLMHFAASLTAAVALFPAHLYEDSIFPEHDEEGKINASWAEHQMRVTMDFGTRNPLVGFFFGGINFHIVHHLFPTVSHVHFPNIRNIITNTAEEFNISYNHVPSLRSALYSHWLLVKKNGVSHLNEAI